MDITPRISSCVREFQDALYAKGSECNKNDRDLYADGPEIEEAILVSCNNIREEAYELIGALTNEGKEDVLKEATDLVYVIFGALARFGLDKNFMPAFNRTHENNLLKINYGWLDNGKLNKPKGHPKVDLRDLVSASLG